jgi:hypothetical protein
MTRGNIELISTFVDAHNPAVSGRSLYRGDMQAWLQGYLIAETTWVGTYYLGNLAMRFVTPDFGPGYDTGSALTYRMFRSRVWPSMAQLVRTPIGMGTLGVAALAGGVYSTTKPGADVNHGPYGSVSVVPRLGIF